MKVYVITFQCDNEPARVFRVIRANRREDAYAWFEELMIQRERSTLTTGEKAYPNGIEYDFGGATKSFWGYNSIWACNVFYQMEECDTTSI